MWSLGRSTNHDNQTLTISKTNRITILNNLLTSQNVVTFSGYSKTKASNNDFNRLNVGKRYQINTKNVFIKIIRKRVY